MDPRHLSKDIAADLAKGTTHVATQIANMYRAHSLHPLRPRGTRPSAIHTAVPRPRRTAVPGRVPAPLSDVRQATREAHIRWFRLGRRPGHQRRCSEVARLLPHAIQDADRSWDRRRSTYPGEGQVAEPPRKGTSSDLPAPHRGSRPGFGNTRLHHGPGPTQRRSGGRWTGRGARNNGAESTTGHRGAHQCRPRKRRQFSAGPLARST
jgi:hypothetical protein